MRHSGLKVKVASGRKADTVRRTPALLAPKAHGRLRDICLQNDIVFLAVFGSTAKATRRQGSDVDILIRFDPARRKTLFDLVDVEDQLTRIFRRKVDLVTVEGLSPFLKKDILESCKVLYDARQNIH